MKCPTRDIDTAQSAQMRRLVSAFVSLQQIRFPRDEVHLCSDVYYQINIRH